MELRTNLGHLLRLAKQLGDAKKSGDPDKIKAAKQAHDTYRDICLKSNTMDLDCTVGHLDSTPYSRTTDG